MKAILILLVKSLRNSSFDYDLLTFKSNFNLTNNSVTSSTVEITEQHIWLFPSILSSRFVCSIWERSSFVELNLLNNYLTLCS